MVNASASVVAATSGRFHAPCFTERALGNTLRALPSRFAVTALRGRVLVHLSGELDVLTAGPLRRAVDDARHRHGGVVEIDAGDVTFLDPAGVNVLLTAQRALQDDGRVLRVVRASPSVDRLLRQAGAERLYGETGRLAPAP